MPSSKVTIYVERDSVSMGDDTLAPHKYCFDIIQNSTISDIFEHLSQKRYLASVSGTGHYWEAIIMGHVVAKFLKNNTVPELSETLRSPISNFVVDGKIFLSFKYYSNTY